MKSRKSKIVSAVVPVALVLSLAAPSTAERSLTSAPAAALTQATPLLGKGVYRKRNPQVKPTACAAPDLVYGGGQVISNVEVVQVNWGASVNPATISLFEKWYPAMVASPYITWLKEYDANSQTIGGGTYHKNPSTSGSWTITPANTATTVSETDIGTELVAQINAGHLPPPTKDAAAHNNTIYMVDFPNGMTETLLGNNVSCQAFCGYHETATDPTLGKVYFGVHPDMGAGSGCEPQGGQWVCGGSTDPLISSAVVHGHELVEAITDPENNTAWLDSNMGCGEIGDICANELGSCGDATCVSASVGSISIGGTPFYAQTEWSNAQSDCVMHGPAVTCTTNAQCAATPGTPICDAGTKTCRACASGDCTGATPACETTGSLVGQCVQCTSATTSACTGATPICDPTMDKCRGCTAADCTAPKAICETAGTKAGSCVQCDPTHTSACTGTTLVCDGASFSCVACGSDADCTAPTPICDPTSKTCRGCSSNTDCTAPEVCATSGAKAGSCVGCNTAADCTKPTAPVCSASTGTCGPCTGASDCPGGTCNASTGECVAKSGGDAGSGSPDGGTEADAGSGGGGSSGGCTVSAPGGAGFDAGLGGLLLGLVVFARRRSAASARS